MSTNHTFKRIWMITGASRGFGAKIAAVALAYGDAVVATARDSQKIIEKFGQTSALLATKLDVTDETQAASAVQAAIQKFGRIDVLVNNAGYGLVGPLKNQVLKKCGVFTRRMFLVF